VADDIVTRLREARIYNCYSCVEYGYDDECDCASRRLLHNDAADEIERLRAELEEAYDACRYALADSPRWQENCATVIATWEARRG